MASRRIPYLDTAKAFSIFVVVVGHYFFVADFYGVHNHLFQFLGQYENYLVAPAMACFFMITGYCSTFEGNVREFIFKQIKQLMLPALAFHFFSLWIDSFLYWPYHHPLHYGLHVISQMILYGGNYWFLTSLFWAKIFYFILRKNLSPNQVLIFSIPIFVVTLIVVNEFGHTPWFTDYALLLFPFLVLGNIAKRSNRFNIRWACIAVYLVMVVFVEHFFDKFTGIQGGMDMNYTQAIPALILILFGALSILFVSKAFPCNIIIQRVGRHTLPIYCLHIVFIDFFIITFGKLLKHSGDIATFFLLLLSVIINIVLCICIGTAYDYIISYFSNWWVKNFKY